MSLYDRIPNNVNLSEDQRLQRRARAVAAQLSGLVARDGADGFQQKDIYLRTATSVEPDGWAHFDYVKMPDYRWGIFLVPPDPEAKIGFWR